VRLSRYGSAKASGAEAADPAPALRTSFPNVEELRIELQFDQESGCAPSSQVHILHPPARLSLRYPCPFPGCTGWFELKGPVTELLKSSAMSFAADARCTGVRPAKANEDTTCKGHLNYRVTARYARVRR
jgi:hypothetical protein